MSMHDDDHCPMCGEWDEEPSDEVALLTKGHDGTVDYWRLSDLLRRPASLSYLIAPERLIAVTTVPVCERLWEEGWEQAEQMVERETWPQRN